MVTRFIEATNEGNWGRFMVAKFDADDWQAMSTIDPDRRILDTAGTNRGDVLVVDLVTCEGAIFSPHGYAGADLAKHRVWVCPMFEPFLKWLYRQDLSDLSKLPAVVELPDAPFALRGYRRAGPEETEVAT